MAWITSEPQSEDLRVMIRYNFGSEKLKGNPKKVALVEAITDVFRNYREGLVYMEGGGMNVVKNEADCEAGEYMGEISRFFV